MLELGFVLRRSGALAGACVAFALVGCSDDDHVGTADQPSTPEVEPRYVIESMIFDDTGQTSYVALLPTLDRSKKVELADTREFAGYAPADPWKGTLLVNDGESPKVTQYEVSDDGEWVEGDALLLTELTSQPLERNIAVSDGKVYVPFDKTNFFAWNPDTFEKEAEVGAPKDIPLVRGEAEDLLANRGYSHELRGSRLFQPYYFADAGFDTYAQESQISVIDTETDEVVKVIDAPCPHLHITTQDEDGNIYLSNGMGSIPAAVASGGELYNCWVKIPAGKDSIDEASTVRFRDLTDGREGSNLFLVSDHLALFNVYHGERDDLGDDPDPDKIDYSENYHLWTYDFETKEAKLMEGIDYAGGQSVVFSIDDRVFVTVPAADYSNTQVYEVSSEGQAKKLFDVEGWAFKLFRLR